MMSVSKWAYDPERCDGQSCCGDCDRCSRWRDQAKDDREEAEEIQRGREQDG